MSRKVVTAGADGNKSIRLYSLRSLHCAAETKAEEIVARNRIAQFPRGVATSMLRSDLKCIPVADVQPFETCLAVSELAVLGLCIAPF